MKDETKNIILGITLFIVIPIGTFLVGWQFDHIWPTQRSYDIWACDGNEWQRVNDFIKIPACHITEPNDLNRVTHYVFIEK